MKSFFSLLLCLLLLDTSLTLSAEPTIKGPAPVRIEHGWVRATNPGQSVGAAYMTLISPQDSTLVYIESTLAGSVEIHSMTMANGIMKMRSLKELTLQANKPEILAPGGFHLMLFDLKAPLKAGDKVTLTLCFKDKNNAITHQEITLPIKETP